MRSASLHRLRSKMRLSIRVIKPNRFRRYLVEKSQIISRVMLDAEQQC